MHRNLLIAFDLDFTLIDNKQGILNSFKYTFSKYQIPLIKEEILEKTIGTPLEEVFKTKTNLNPSKLVKAFRDYYGQKGIYQVKLYEGVIEKLEAFKKAQIKLGIVTSKKREMAIRLLKYLNIFHYFEFVIGETDTIKKKTNIEVKQFFYNNFPHYDFIIVGDHLTDRYLAEMLECPFIGILTGHCTEKELKTNSRIPVLVLNNISELNLEAIFNLIDLYESHNNATSSY
jgi:phosphoglycolate phosphatase